MTEGIPEPFFPATRVAVQQVNEWTEDEARFAWFYLCGARPDVIEVVHNHIMMTRRLTTTDFLGESHDSESTVQSPVDDPLPALDDQHGV